MTHATFEIRPLASALGAEVFGLDLSESPGNADINALAGAWLRHSVLVIRDQPITPRQFLAFVRRFGEIVDYPFAASVEGVPELTEIAKLPTDTQAFGSGWHMDMSFRSIPPMGTILHGKEIPPVGGDTCFASLIYAWKTLSETMQRTISGLVAVHESWPPDPRQFEGISFRDLDTPREVARHRLAGRHPESGEPLLFISPYYAREIEGMSPAESRALLEFLNGHATRNELTCRVRWEPDSIVMWDNRCTVHEALDDDLEAQLTGTGYSRLMHRVVIRDSRDRGS